MLIRSLLIIMLGVGEVALDVGAWLYAGPSVGLITLGLIFTVNYFILYAHRSRQQANQHYQAMRKANQTRMEDLRSEQRKMWSH